MPALIPVVGPAIALANANVRKEGNTVLLGVVSTVGQIAGLAVFVYGCSVPSYTLVEGEDVSVRISPMHGGLLVSSTF